MTLYLLPYWVTVLFLVNRKQERVSGWVVNRSSVENAFRHPKIIVLLLTGVEDGQTVRMPVGKREIFITFRVGALFARPLLGLCSRGEGAAQASYG